MEQVSKSIEDVFSMPKTKKSKMDLPENSTVFVIRIRGPVKTRGDINDTLNMLRLNRVNIGVILQLNPSIKGMLQKVKDYISWGPVDKKILFRLLQKRGRVLGNQRLTDEFLAENVKDFPSVKVLSEAVADGKVHLKDLKNVKPVFRLHPPRGGHRGGIKKPFNAGGTLGYVGEYMNTLLTKMM